MTTNRDPLIARFSGELMLVEESMATRLDAAMSALREHANFADIMREQSTSGDSFWPEPGTWQAMLRPYQVANGILQIPVYGFLLNNFPWALGQWATGYEYIQRAVERGCEDFRAGNIKGIALVGNSCGGLVAGLYDMLDRCKAAIRAAGVPMRAFVQPNAYSAAYAVLTMVAASPDGKIVVNQVGGTGSIGTLVTHVSYAKMNDQIGLEYTFIYAGACKVDGNSNLPLSDRARKRLQSRVDELNALFINTVAEARGLTPETVSGFEAATFTPSESLSNGLADEIGSLDDALAAFAADLCPDPNDEEQSMTTETKGVDQATHDSAVAAAREEGRTAGLAEGQKAGAAAERELVFAIIDSDEAKKRPAAARALAAEGGRTLEQATTFLARLPEEPAASAPRPGATEPGAQTPFDNAMSRENPEVGGEGGEGGEQQVDPVALARQVGLSGVRPAPAKS